MRRSATAVAGAALFLAAPAFSRERPAVPMTPGPVPCPSKGPRFVRLPGSDNCIRVSGRVAAGMDLHAGPGAAPPVAGSLAIDNRADTELGEVRTYVQIGNGRR